MFKCPKNIYRQKNQQHASLCCCALCCEVKLAVLLPPAESPQHSSLWKCSMWCSAPWDKKPLCGFEHQPVTGLFTGLKWKIPDSRQMTTAIAAHLDFFRVRQCPCSQKRFPQQFISPLPDQLLHRKYPVQELLPDSLLVLFGLKHKKTIKNKLHFIFRAQWYIKQTFSLTSSPSLTSRISANFKTSWKDWSTVRYWGTTRTISHKFLRTLMLLLSADSLFPDLFSLKMQIWS